MSRTLTERAQPPYPFRVRKLGFGETRVVVGETVLAGKVAYRFEDGGTWPREDYVIIEEET